MRQIFPARAAALLLCLMLGPAAQAADWNMTSLWLLQGSQFELGDDHRRILRSEHADGWAYGDNYFFFDIIEPQHSDSGVGTMLYGEFESRFSLGKISGHKLAWGPVTDLLLTASINGGDDFRAYLYGGSVDLGLPGFAYFHVSAYVRDDQSLPGTTWQITPCWLRPFTVGGLRFDFQGFIDYAGKEGVARSNLLVVPRLWLDVGALWGAPGHVQAGVEYLYWRNKYGVDGVTEQVLQPALRWTF